MEEEEEEEDVISIQQNTSRPRGLPPNCPVQPIRTLSDWGGVGGWDVILRSSRR